VSEDFTPEIKALLRKKGFRTPTSSAKTPTVEPPEPVPATTTTMAQKTLHEFSVPAIANVPTGPVVDIGNRDFEL
jgi:hypothetical protein